MKKFLKSLFSGSGEEAIGPVGDVGVEAGKDSRSIEAPPSPEPSFPDTPSSEAGNVDRRSSPASLEESDIIAALVSQVCSTMPDPRPAEEIDPEIHMYDAGYVTSISAADLLAFVDEHYGLDISETKLIGPLQNLSALAKHIREHAVIAPRD